MALDTGYAEAFERWTWKRQTMDDETTKILSPLKVQSHGGCSYFAVAVTLEPNLKVQWKKNVTLSISHLKKLAEELRTRMPNERATMKRFLSMVENEGVFEEKQYERIEKDKLSERVARKYKITRFTAYDVNSPENVRDALRQLRRGGPLLAVIRISRNYHDCFRSGLIYRFDPNQVATRYQQEPTHAVSVVSFGMEAKVPILECQDSRGEGFGRNGFLAVDITSVKELYSIRIRLSS